MARYTKWERFYQKLNMIFHGIVASTMIPFAWAFLETQKEFPEGPLLDRSFVLVFEIGVIAVAAILIIYSHFSAKNGLEKVWREAGIEAKLSVYLQEKVKLYALLELAALLGFVGLYLTKEHLFTVVYLVVLFIFSLRRPSFDRVARETRIRSKELQDWAKNGENI